MDSSEADIKKLATEADKTMANAMKSVGSARKAIESLDEGGDAKFAADLKDFAKREAKQIVMRTARFELRLRRLKNLTALFQSWGTEKKCAGMQKLYEDAL